MHLKSTLWSRGAIPILLGAAALSCGGGGGTGQGELGTAQQALLGDSLAGISAADFQAAEAAFSTVEGITDGLGPIFNAEGCAVCHSNGAVGGAGQQIERRFGKFVNGIFDPLANEGGSLRQLFSLGTFNNGSTVCTVPVEVEPADATMHNVGRRTIPLFGLGLVDAMPDAFFAALARQQPAAMRGVVNQVSVLLPNPADPTQHIGSTRVARFGWKANVPSLMQFAADAYLNEMGITTQHCFRGRSVIDFAIESAPNGIPQPAGCDDLAPPAPAGVPPGTDDAVGACTPGKTQIQDDVAEFNTFMTFLAPPARDLSNPAGIAQGEPVFTQIGCATCHVPTTFTTPPNPFNGVPGKFAFNPYSDFLAHDMVALGDMIGNAGDSVAVTRRMRTQPLWGNRFETQFLHDGRAANIAEAIGFHDGQAAAARDAFNALSPGDQAALVQFVQSL